MRNMLTVAALLVFVVSSGLLEMVRDHDRPITALPPAMGEFVPANVDTTGDVWHRPVAARNIDASGLQAERPENIRHRRQRQDRCSREPDRRCNHRIRVAGQPLVERGRHA